MTEKTPVISVVIPVYKVEAYLGPCLESLLGQTFEDYEIILVDDGSPDGCPALCDSYAARDPRVRVIHQENSGPSAARNAGMAAARGSYLTFVDGDDQVTDRYLEILFEAIEKNRAQMSAVQLYSFFQGQPLPNEEPGDTLVVTGARALEMALYQDKLDTSPCGLLLPTEVAKKFPFPVGKFYEDTFTTFQYYPQCSRVAVVDYKGYCYLQRPHSTMHTFGKSRLDELDSGDHLVKVCEAKWPYAVAAAHAKKFSNYCQVLLSVDDLKHREPEMYRRITAYLKERRLPMLLDRRARKKNRFAALCLMAGPKGLMLANRVMARMKKSSVKTEAV